MIAAIVAYLAVAWFEGRRQRWLGATRQDAAVYGWLWPLARTVEGLAPLLEHLQDRYADDRRLP